MEILIENKIYKVNNNELLGIFFAIKSLKYKNPIILKSNTNTYDIITIDMINKQNVNSYLYFELNKVNQIDKFYLMDYVLYYETQNLSILINFNDTQILNGINLFLTTQNIYPSNMVLLKKENNVYLNHKFDVTIVNYLNNHSFVAPKKIKVILDSVEHELICNGPNGWSGNDLFSKISSLQKNSNKLCTHVKSINVNSFLAVFG